MPYLFRNSQLADGRSASSSSRVAFWSSLPLLLKVTPVTFNVAFACVTSGAVLNAIVPTLIKHNRGQIAGFAINPDLGVSKVVIVCVFIALTNLFRTPASELRPVEALFLLPALLGTLATSGTAAWAGLALSTGSLLLWSDRSGDMKAVLWIILVASLHAPASSLLGQLSGGTLLGLDRWAALTVLSLFTDIENLQGNAIQIAGGEILMLVWECGVLKNVSLVLLLWISVLNIGLRSRIRPRIGDAFLLIVFCILMNAVRLTLMALQENWFDYLHDGQGATIFRLILLAAALVVASWRKSRDAF